MNILAILYLQQKCHKSHPTKTSAGVISARNLYKCRQVFACDRYVFVLLGSVWCRECPRRALKSTIQGPKCQNTSPQPFRPSDSTKMASIAFFVLQSASYKWPHSTPVWHLTGLWIPLPEKADAKNNTLRRAAFAALLCECFFDFIWGT